MFRPVNCAGDRVQAPLVASYVPALSVAPDGTPVIVTLATSTPPVPTAAMFRPMPVLSSAPVEGDNVKLGLSSTGVTFTVTAVVVVALSLTAPNVSVEVLATVRSNEPLKFAGGVIVKPAKSVAGSRLHVPSAFFVPADSVAPAGTPEITIDNTSEPSTSVSAVAMFNAIAVSSAPPCVAALSVGASATGFTPTVAVPDAVEPSAAVATTFRSKLPE